MTQSRVLKPTKKQADEAFNRLEKIRQLKRRAGEYLYQMGKELYHIYQEYEKDLRMAYQLYHFMSFNALIEAPEKDGGIEFERSYCYRLVGIYKKYELELGCRPGRQELPNIDHKKLDMMRRVVSRDNLEE